MREDAMPEYIGTHMDAGCLWMTLQRPKVNALNVKLLREIRETVQAAEADAAIRCMVIHGGAGKFFSGGADIPSIQDALGSDPFAKGALLSEGQQTMNVIEGCGKPVIAAVNGAALGGGCELALACHLRLASTEATFGQPEINLGIMPGWGATYRLARQIGHARALDWMLTGRMVGAQEAYEAGLLCKLVKAEELVAAAQELAGTVSRKSPLAMRAILETVQNQALHPADASELETRGFQRCMASHDAVEGVSAFLDKRTPHFTGE